MCEREKKKRGEKKKFRFFIADIKINIVKIKAFIIETYAESALRHLNGGAA